MSIVVTKTFTDPLGAHAAIDAAIADAPNQPGYVAGMVPSSTVTSGTNAKDGSIIFSVSVTFDVSAA